MRRQAPATRRSGRLEGPATLAHRRRTWSEGVDLAAAQVTVLVNPVLVVVAPGWGYDGSLNWSSGVDLVLQGIGWAMWATGMSVAVWAARSLGRFVTVDGLAVDHELVTSGPYRHVRHPVYASFVATRWPHLPSGRRILRSGPRRAAP